MKKKKKKHRIDECFPLKKESIKAINNLKKMKGLENSNLLIALLQIFLKTLKIVKLNYLPSQILLDVLHTDNQLQ